jgi:hypothetical protein
VLYGLDSYVIRQRRSADGSGFRLGLDYLAAAHSSCAFFGRSYTEKLAALLQLILRCQLKNIRLDLVNTEQDPSSRNQVQIRECLEDFSFSILNSSERNVLIRTDFL